MRPLPSSATTKTEFIIIYLFILFAIISLFNAQTHKVTNKQKKWWKNSAAHPPFYCGCCALQTVLIEYTCCVYFCLTLFAYDYLGQQQFAFITKIFFLLAPLLYPSSQTTSTVLFCLSHKHLAFKTNSTIVFSFFSAESGCVGWCLYLNFVLCFSFCISSGLNKLLRFFLFE